jgi:hypothetical protein
VDVHAGEVAGELSFIFSYQFPLREFLHLRPFNIQPPNLVPPKLKPVHVVGHVEVQEVSISILPEQFSLTHQVCLSIACFAKHAGFV